MKITALLKTLSVVLLACRNVINALNTLSDFIIYYSKFVKGQNFNSVCRRSCVSDTKKFMIDM